MTPSRQGPTRTSADAADELTPAQRQEDARRRERYGLLLTAIIAAFAVQGIATPSRAEQILVTALLAATLLLSFWAADLSPRLMRPLVALSLLLIVAALADSSTGGVSSETNRIANLLLVLLAPPAIVVGVGRNLRKRQAVTLEAVFGTLCLYLLLGMFFAYVYAVVGKASPPFFATGSNADNIAHYLYFSFTTLTTVGYGDFTARSNLGHTLSVFEALLGQLYLVTVVSMIVSNLALRDRPLRRRRS